jgi:hypothetical protein
VRAATCKKSIAIKKGDLDKKKTIIRRAWLKSLAKQKVGFAKIAKRLRRTPGATAAKAHALGFR